MTTRRDMAQEWSQERWAVQVDPDLLMASPWILTSPREIVLTPGQCIVLPGRPVPLRPRQAGLADISWPRTNPEPYTSDHDA